MASPLRLNVQRLLRILMKIKKRQASGVTVITEKACPKSEISKSEYISSLAKGCGSSLHIKHVMNII
jgi:hypothetical protein